MEYPCGCGSKLSLPPTLLNHSCALDFETEGVESFSKYLELFPEEAEPV